jgi:hypothetical protein
VSYAPPGADALWCSAICFDTQPVESLLQLGTGDPVAVSTTAKLTRWIGKYDVDRTGISITGQKVMS